VPADVVKPGDNRRKLGEDLMAGQTALQKGERLAPAALGLVAAEVGLCIVPAAARLRADLVYRLIAHEEVTSPIILSHRLNDDSWYIVAIKQLIAEMYAQNPPWLDVQTNAFPSHPAIRAEEPSTKDGADPK
jgi:hypothetical protein